MSYLISIDAGMAQTKFAYVNPRTGAIEVDLFQTICADYDPHTLQAPDCVVTYEGKTYVIGDSEYQHSLPRENTKLTEMHQLCVFTAIAKSLVRLNANITQTLSVNICLNVPLEEFRSAERTAEYSANYKGSAVTIELNGQLIRFVIDHVTLNYEGQGAIFHACQQDDSLKTGLVCLTDIGGFNDSCICLSSLRPVANGNRAMANGVLRLFYNVACELSQNPSNGRLTKFDIERMSKGEHDFIAEGFEDVYHRQAAKLVHEIKENILNNATTPARTKFVFSGGGSQALEKEIREAFKEYEVVILQDSQFDNCLGMLEYALYKESQQA